MVGNKMNKEKKDYIKPIVKKHGNIKDITQGGGGNFEDAFEAASI